MYSRTVNAMTKIAKLFRNANSQAVRLPQEMRFKGDRVRVRKVDTVILEPVITNVREWFADMDRHGAADPFEGDWRNQPKAPNAKSLNELLPRYQCLRCHTSTKAAVRQDRGGKDHSARLDLGDFVSCASRALVRRIQGPSRRRKCLATAGISCLGNRGPRF
jgi:virulence-associated protein VagC